MRYRSGGLDKLDHRSGVRALLVLVMVGLLAACGQTGTNEAGYISGDGRTQEIPVADREEPVELVGETLDGKPFDLADTRGKVTVLNVWWTGCGPCRKEMPMLQAAYEELGDEVAFVGLNTRDASAAQGQAFERHYGVEYPSVYSPDGAAVLALKGSLAPRAIPATAILDTDGRVAALIRGEIPSARTLDTLITAAGKGTSAGSAAPAARRPAPALAALPSLERTPPWHRDGALPGHALNAARSSLRSQPRSA